MPDLGPVVGELFEVVAPLLKPLVRIAARTLFGTLLGAVVLGLATLVGAYELGARAGAARGLLAIAVAALLMAVLVPIIAVKRALGKAMVHAFESLGIGRKLVGVLFDGIVRMDGDGEAGARGSSVQRGVERLPLAEVERRLSLLVARVTGEGDGFFASRLRRALLEKVGALTLAELRAEGEQAGGVDLVLARQRIEAAVDQQLVARARGALATTTAVLGAALLVGSLGAAYFIGR